MGAAARLAPAPQGIRAKGYLRDTERDRIRAALAQVATKQGAYCLYKPGWSDERVAALAIPHFPGDGAKVVTRMRKLLVGYLKP